MILLLHPPIAKPSEPPAGIARLSGALGQHHVAHRLLDMNIEAQLWLALKAEGLGTDTWSTIAKRNAQINIDALRDPQTYIVFDRYSRTVRDVNKAIQTSGAGKIALASYEDETLSPLRSKDLIHAATEPQQNPFYAYFSKRLLEIMQKDNPTHIGFSVNYLSQAICAFAMAGFIKHHAPKIHIIMGGGLITSWMRQPKWDSAMFSSLVDDFVSGAGEEKLLAIMGVTSDKQHITPDYSSLPLSDYLSPGRILPYSASSGCWWGKCSFCPETAEGGPYKKTATGDVISDIANEVARSKPVLLHLLDNSVSPALIKGLMENPTPVPWYGFARLAPELCDDDYCRMLKASGCVMLKLGLESGDQGVLDSMQKGIDINTASLALKALKRAGIATFVYLLFGTPTESYKEARHTLEFTVQHASEIGFLNVAIFNMPAFGQDAQKFDTREFFEGDLTLYSNFEHPLGFSRGKVRRFLGDEFKKEKSIAGIIRRTPPVFTSNHAPFFV
jgi:hypothetical protein